MSVVIKVARTARELDDVFKLRYDVYVREKQRFSSNDIESRLSQRIVDQFDSIPGVANIIAYENNIPIACLRVNKDSEIGLPSDMYFDFSKIRSNVADSLVNKTEHIIISPVFVSGGMLVIGKKWRNRRTVIYALFKIAFGIMHSLGATHVLATVSESSKSLYGRIGFEEMDKPEWNEAVKDMTIPMLAPFDKVFKWAFGDDKQSINPFWLDNFSGRFERLLLSTGEVLFKQKDPGGNAYAIDDGWISISQKDHTGNEMVLSNLSKGDLFGELAVFDSEPRSATATAITNVELIVIQREKLLAMVKKNPEQMGEILQHFSKRLRQMDAMTMVRTFSPQKARVKYALNRLWVASEPDSKQPDVRIAKVGPKQIAKSACVREDEVIEALEIEKAKGNLEYTKTIVRFLVLPTTNDIGLLEFDEP